MKQFAIHGVRSWWSNIYWTSIFLVFKQLEKKDEELELQSHAVQNCGQVIV